MKQPANQRHAAPPIDRYFAQHLASYASNPLFAGTDAWVMADNPYRRPIRPQDLGRYRFSVPLEMAAFESASALAAQRMLLNIYEHDLMFLPEDGFAAVSDDFKAFYAAETMAAGEAVRATLERHVFDFLMREIDTSGKWTAADMTALFDRRLAAAAEADSAIAQAVTGARDSDAAATLFLVQLASDFLSEASAMARNVLGNFGPTMSELFKVLIDEYGYGVHDTKHSTLFGETLKSRGLSTHIHAYWQFYQTSSLALTNYFHYVSKNHRHFFRYLGALYFAEASLVHVTRQQSKMLRAVWGDDVDTTYFDEHTHIDAHHGRMVIDNIIAPTIERCGTTVIPDIVRGFEEFRLLQDLADADLIAQITWSDQRHAYAERGQSLLAAIAPGDLDAGSQRFEETAGELSVTHVHDEDELFIVDDGEIELVTAPDQAISLGPGQAIVIPAQRLHGSLVTSPRCAYRVFPIAGR